MGASLNKSAANLRSTDIGVQVATLEGLLSRIRTPKTAINMTKHKNLVAALGHVVKSSSNVQVKGLAVNLLQTLTPALHVAADIPDFWHDALLALAAEGTSSEEDIAGASLLALLHAIDENEMLPHKISLAKIPGVLDTLALTLKESPYNGVKMGAAVVLFEISIALDTHLTMFNTSALVANLIDGGRDDKPGNIQAMSFRTLNMLMKRPELRTPMFNTSGLVDVAVEASRQGHSDGARSGAISLLAYCADNEDNKCGASPPVVMFHRQDVINLICDLGAEPSDKIRLQIMDLVRMLDRAPGIHPYAVTNQWLLKFLLGRIREEKAEDIRDMALTIMINVSTMETDRMALINFPEYMSTMINCAKNDSLTFIKEKALAALVNLVDADSSSTVIAVRLFDEPGLIDAAMDAVQGTDTTYKEMALMLFNNLALAKANEARLLDLPNLVSVLITSMQNPETEDIRVLAQTVLASIHGKSS